MKESNANEPLLDDEIPKPTLLEIQLEIAKEQLIKARKDNKRNYFGNLHLYLPFFTSIVVAASTLFILSKNNFFDAKSSELRTTNLNLEMRNIKLKDKQDSITHLVTIFENNKDSIQVLFDLFTFKVSQLADSVHALELQKELTNILLSKSIEQNNKLQAENIAIIGQNKDLNTKYENTEMDYIYSRNLYNIKQVILSPAPSIYAQELIDSLKNKSQNNQRILDDINRYFIHSNSLDLQAIGNYILFFGTGVEQYRANIFAIGDSMFTVMESINGGGIIFDDFNNVLASTNWEGDERVEIIQYLVTNLEKRNLRVNFYPAWLYVISSFHTKDYNFEIGVLQPEMFFTILNIFNRIIYDKDLDVSNATKLAEYLIRISPQYYACLLYYVMYRYHTNQNNDKYVYDILYGQYLAGGLEYYSLSNHKNLKSYMEQLEIPKDINCIQCWNDSFNKNYVTIEKWIDPQYAYFRAHIEELKIKINKKLL